MTYVVTWFSRTYVQMWCYSEIGFEGQVDRCSFLPNSGCDSSVNSTIPARRGMFSLSPFVLPSVETQGRPRLTFLLRFSPSFRVGSPQSFSEGLTLMWAFLAVEAVVGFHASQLGGLEIRLNRLNLELWEMQDEQGIQRRERDLKRARAMRVICDVRSDAYESWNLYLNHPADWEVCSWWRTSFWLDGVCLSTVTF